MMGYLVSLLMGLVVGVAYGLVQVRSPAPPLIALVGLLGWCWGSRRLPRQSALPRRPRSIRSLTISNGLANRHQGISTVPVCNYPCSRRRMLRSPQYFWTASAQRPARRHGLRNGRGKGNQAIDRRQGEFQAGLVRQSSILDLVGDVADDDLRTENRA